MADPHHRGRSAVEHIDGPDGGPHTHKCPLVVGYDGGDISHRALTWSLQFASGIGGSVLVVHVIDTADHPSTLTQTPTKRTPRLRRVANVTAMSQHSTERTSHEPAVRSTELPAAHWSLSDGSTKIR
ncbi:universal stress protein [Rhodococcus sp. 14-2483-1-2]|uniref:universal stress protein n=1 Tax=Rhodococcus sp. 14-2483-1-2 TaxID=2023147 RepID=UPI001483228A